MDRRALLASLAAGAVGIAGCSSSQSSDEPTDNDTEPTTNADPDTTGSDPTTEQSESSFKPPTDPQTVIDLETGPRTYALSRSTIRTSNGGRIEFWFDRTATAEHPLRLRGSLTNPNEFENTIETGNVPMLTDHFASPPDGYTYGDHVALTLVPTENNELAETTSDVERGEDGYWRATDTDSSLVDVARLDPAERVDLEFLLVGEPEISGHPTGSYTFQAGADAVVLRVWDTPGPDVESRFAGRELPPFENDGPVQWYHEAGPETHVYVRPSTERLELNGRIRFEALNHSPETTGPGHWNLYKLVDSEWFHIAPLVHNSNFRHLGSGGRREWSLRAFHGESVPCGDGRHWHGLSQGHLGGGEYAVVAGFHSYEEGDGDPAAQRSGALFELVGEPVTPTLSDDVQTEREGDTVILTAESYDDDEYPPDAVFEMTRTETAEERLIAEQVMRSATYTASRHGIGNLLAAIESGVRRVILRTDENRASDIEAEDRTRRVRFRGQAYEVVRTE